MAHGEHSQLTSTEIEIIVGKSVRQTLITLGIDLTDVEDLRSLQADFLYMRRSRLGAEEVGKWMKKSVVTAVIAGGLYALWAGILVAFKKAAG